MQLKSVNKQKTLGNLLYVIVSSEQGCVSLREPLLPQSHWRKIIPRSPHNYGCVSPSLPSLYNQKEDLLAQKHWRKQISLLLTSFKHSIMDQQWKVSDITLLKRVVPWRVKHRGIWEQKGLEATVDKKIPKECHPPSTAVGALLQQIKEKCGSVELWTGRGKKGGPCTSWMLCRCHLLGNEAHITCAQRPEIRQWNTARGCAVCPHSVDLPTLIRNIVEYLPKSKMGKCHIKLLISAFSWKVRRCVANQGLQPHKAGAA